MYKRRIGDKHQFEARGFQAVGLKEDIVSACGDTGLTRVERSYLLGKMPMENISLKEDLI